MFCQCELSHLLGVMIRPAVASFVPMISSLENLLPTMTERILGWAGVECSSPIIANIIEAASNQEERQFIRWCQGSECNPVLHAIDKRCASLLYLSLKLTMHSAEHLTSLQVAAQSGVYSALAFMADVEMNNPESLSKVIGVFV